MDIIATRNDHTLVAEAKGTTTAAGLDVDTAFGQLLRRTRDDDSTTIRTSVSSRTVQRGHRVLAVGNGQRPTLASMNGVSDAKEAHVGRMG